MKHALGGFSGWVLILLSVAVLTVTFERVNFWVLWWRRRFARQQQWSHQLRMGRARARAWMDERDYEMCFAQSFLGAVSVIAPMIGLIGTVLSFARLLATLGPQLLLPADSNLNGFADALLCTAFGLIVSLMASVTFYFNNGLRNWQLSLWRLDCQRSINGSQNP